MTMNHVGDLRPNGEGFGLGFGIVTDVAKTGNPGSEGMYFWNGAYSTFFFHRPAGGNDHSTAVAALTVL